MMKTALITIVSLIAIFLMLESALRLFFGLGNPPLYLPDETIGYLLAPNQKIRRRGNRIKINQYSMRSEDITAQKPPKTSRIMLLGDSIVNGNWWTDQQNILSELIRQSLSEQNQQVQVLNVSANSWNPRNELAYVQRFGLFEADILVLVINTDDLFGTAPTSIVVGKDPSYQNTKPALALMELVQKYLKKSTVIPQLQQIQQEKGDRVGFNLEAISQIKAIAQTNNTRFILAFTPLLRELQQGSRDYELKARKRVQQLVEKQNIIYLDFLTIFTDFPQPEFLYRDHIHLSPQGENLVSQQLAKTIQEILNDNN